MAKPTLDASTMTRLALIRLLYLQGAEQAAQPEPMCLFSLLTFHDSVELFLILAADHLGVQPPARDPNFLDYWHILRPTDAFPAGVSLTGRGRMDRLNRHRNALKHAGALPSRAAVEDSLTSTKSFFEDNTEVVFGVAFDAIDMADVVPQDDIRKVLKSAASAEAAANRKEAMAYLAWAFAKLLSPYAQLPYSPYRFGGSIRRRTTATDGIGPALESLAREVGSKQVGDLRDAAERVDDIISQLHGAVPAMQRGMRVMALGIDYRRYTRFEQLTPGGGRDEEQPVMIVDTDYSPTREEYDYCFQFVINAALRVAEVDAKAVEPSWIRARTTDKSVGRELLRPSM